MSTLNTTSAPMTTAIALLDPATAAGANGLALVPGSPEFREHVERGATELARVFRETTTNMRRLWGEFTAQCDRLDEAMRPEQEATGHSYRSFNVDLHFAGKHVYDHRSEGKLSPVDQVIKQMNTKVWSLLIERLGVKNVMSIARRAEFNKQIESGDVPEVTEANILNVVMGLADQASDFATEAAKETLALLTPHSGYYATNSGFKVGRRVILTYYVEQGWSTGAFRPNYRHEPELTAIDGTFHVLDGKGPIKGRKCPLIQAIIDSPDGRGETDFFTFRACKNRNLHLGFKRLDLVKKLNGLATGEFVLGQDPE